MHICMFLILLTVFQFHQTVASTSVSENVVNMSNMLKSLDDRITEVLQKMPRNKGEYLLEIMKDYNSKLTKLEELLITHRNKTLECPEAVKLLRDGAPDYFLVNIDRDTAMLNFGWLDKGLDDVFEQRAASMTVWSRINRRSRLIPLQYYTYPENSTYTGYESPLCPPLREREKRD